MAEWTSFLDLTGRSRALRLSYEGAQAPQLEARIFAENESQLEIGVSLWEEDVVSHAYDPAKRSLDIVYRAPPADELRAGLAYQRFQVPKEIATVTLIDER
jgi:hypothetical protein